MECGQCYVKKVPLFECAFNGSLYCTSCIQAEHLAESLRYVRKCSLCKIAPSTITCETCRKMMICGPCQAKFHRDHDCIPMQWPKHPKTRHHEGIHRLMLLTPSRNIQITPDASLLRMKDRVIKMLRLAANPGTIEEGKHAAKLATQWMEKYQLDKATLLSENESPSCGEYEIQVRMSTDAWQGADKVFQSACVTWIRDLAILVADIHTDFVKGFAKKMYLFDHTWYSITFIGIEDAAWSAVDLFCELFRMICCYINIMVVSGRYTEIKTIESYAMGLVKGLAARKFKTKLQRTEKSDELYEIRNAARIRIAQWSEQKRITVSGNRRIKKIDVRAHEEGRYDSTSVESSQS